MSWRMNLHRKYSVDPEVDPVTSKKGYKAMALDASTELLFLDTFKHQSAEVIFFNPRNILFFIFSRLLALKAKIGRTYRSLEK